MTKSVKLDASSIITSAAPAAALPTKPYVLTVFGPTPLAMQELAAHVRNGYVPSSDTFVDMNSAAGTIRVVMHLGDPDKLAIERAATNQADAAAIQQASYERDVQLAAERIIANAKRAEADAKRAALIEEQRKALAALEKQFAAEAAADAVAAK